MDFIGVLSQIEIRAWEISRLHVFADVDNLAFPRFKIRQRYLVVQAEEGGFWRPAFPRKKPMSGANQAGVGPLV
jgi:predicted nuclease of restriction endonuclease-like RecB superfamily